MAIRKKVNPTSDEVKVATEVQAPLPVKTNGQKSQELVNTGHPATRQIVLPEPTVSLAELAEHESTALSLEDGGYEAFLPRLSGRSLGETRQPFLVTDAEIKEGLKHGTACIYSCVFSKGAHESLRGREFSLMLSYNEGRGNFAKKVAASDKAVGPLMIVLLPSTKGNPFSQFANWDGKASNNIALEVEEIEEGESSPFDRLP